MKADRRVEQVLDIDEWPTPPDRGSRADRFECKQFESTLFVLFQSSRLSRPGGAGARARPTRRRRLLELSVRSRSSVRRSANQRSP